MLYLASFWTQFLCFQPGTRGMSTSRSEKYFYGKKKKAHPHSFTPAHTHLKVIHHVNISLMLKKKNNIASNKNRLPHLYAHSGHSYCCPLCPLPWPHHLSSWRERSRRWQHLRKAHLPLLCKEMLSIWYHPRISWHTVITSYFATTHISIWFRVIRHTKRKK